MEDRMAGKSLVCVMEILHSQGDLLQIIGALEPPGSNGPGSLPEGEPWHVAEALQVQFQIAFDDDFQAALLDGDGVHEFAGGRRDFLSLYRNPPHANKVAR